MSSPITAAFSHPVEKAVAIALHAHAGQVDKAGAPYVLHPLRVMARMTDDLARMAAVLHDVVEDGPGWTFDRLRAEGIPAAVVEALTFLTKRPEEEGDYDAFIRRVAGNALARRVKLGDLDDNMDLSRISAPTEADLRRLEKYRRARTLLEGLGP
jgi:hypothetical protein